MEIFITLTLTFGGARGVMVIVVGNGHVGKGMNPIILPPTMGK